MRRWQVDDRVYWHVDLRKAGVPGYKMGMLARVVAVHPKRVKIRLESDETERWVRPENLALAFSEPEPYPPGHRYY